MKRQAMALGLALILALAGSFAAIHFRQEADRVREDLAQLEEDAQQSKAAFTEQREAANRYKQIEEDADYLERLFRGAAYEEGAGRRVAKIQSRIKQRYGAEPYDLDSILPAMDEACHMAADLLELLGEGQSLSEEDRQLAEEYETACGFLKATARARYWDRMG